MSLKQKVFKEAINTVVASKNLRRMAVNQLDRMIYKSNIKEEGNGSDPVYADILRDYDRELERLTQKLFEEEYLRSGLKEAVGLQLETN